MQTLESLTQEITAQVEGGISTDETKFEPLFVESIIHQTRATLLKPQTVVSQLWVNEYNPPYSVDLQEGDFCDIIIEVPAPIMFDRHGEGLIYIGAANGKQPFRRIGYLGDSSLAFQHPLTKPSEKDVSYSVSAKDKDFLVVQVYGNVSLENILVKVVAYNPTLLPSFRRDTDLYPITGDLITQMKSGVANSLMSQMAQTPADTLGDTQDPMGDIYSALNRMKKRR